MRRLMTPALQGLRDKLYRPQFKVMGHTCGWKKKSHYGLVLCICALAVDVHVTREEYVVIGIVGKISHGSVWCNTFVRLIVAVQATRENDAVIGDVGKMTYSMALCSVFVQH